MRRGRSLAGVSVVVLKFGLRVGLAQQVRQLSSGPLAGVDHAHPVQRRVERVRHHSVGIGVVEASVDDLIPSGLSWRRPEQQLVRRPVNPEIQPVGPLIPVQADATS